MTTSGEVMSVRLEKELRRDLNTVCGILEVSTSDAIREAVRNWIDDQAKSPNFQAKFEAAVLRLSGGSDE